MDYIRIPTELLKDPDWRCELKSDTKIFFMDLLIRSTYKECEVSFMGEIFQLETGQVVITIRSLAKALDISENDVRKHLSKLVLMGLISTEVTQRPHRSYTENFKRRRTIVTICNPNLYFGKYDPVIYDLDEDEFDESYTLYKEINIINSYNKKNK
ncbi:MAG: hypothetical protein ACRCTF_05360 [Bacteroidales bacterium]